MSANILVKVDHQQVANVAHLLATHNTSVFGSDVNEIRNTLYRRLADAVEQNLEANDTFTVSTAGYVILVWILDADHAKEVGYTHETELFIDASILFNQLNQGLGEDIMVITPVAPAPSKNGPDRIRYIHLRSIDEVVHSATGVVLDSTLNRNGGITVAFQDNLDGTLTYSFARCSKRDQYNKKVGNEIARNRLANPTTSYVFEGTINEFRPWVESNMNAVFG